MTNYVITKEMLLRARDYVPAREKEVFCSAAAQNCFDKLSVRASINGAEVEMPPMYGENGVIRSRYLLSALLRLYFRVDYEPVEADGFILALDDYDRWAAHHPLNTIERMKSRADLKDKAFDLLADYRELERLLNNEIRKLSAAYNDTVSRLVAELSGNMTPEAIEAFDELQRQMQERLAAVKKVEPGVIPDAEGSV